MAEPYRNALIVGAGVGLSASLARALSNAGLAVALAARNPDKLTDAPKNAQLFRCDASRRGDVEKLFADVEKASGAPDVVIYNASYRHRGALVDLDPDEVRKALDVTAYGAFLVAQQAARRMVPRKHGAIFFTGASASVKGYAQSAPFAMGKFALRGLAQSMARELSPLGIHVAHFVIDGGIRSAARAEPADKPDSLLDPDAIAANYLHMLTQPRSAWTWEIEMRPWVERF